MPGVAELESVLIDTCRSFREVFLVIDALDECDFLEHRPRLLKTLQIFRERSGKLFVTSRPFAHDIRKSFTSGRQLPVFAHQEDIRRFLLGKMDDSVLAKEIMDDDLQQLIVRIIIEQSKGM